MCHKLHPGLAVAVAFGAALAGCGGHEPSIDRVPASYQLTEPSLIVAVGGAGTMRVLKQSDLSTIANVPMRPETVPHHLGLSSNRALLSISLLPGGGGGHHGGEGEGEILVLDTLTGAEQASIVVPGVAHNATFLKDGRLVWSDRLVGTVNFGRPNVMTQAVDVEVAVPLCAGPLEVTATLDSQRVIVACEDADIISILDVTSRVKSDIAVGDRPIAAWIGADNRYYVTNEGSKTLSVGALGQTPTTVTLGYTPGQVVTNPTGSEVAIADEEGGRVVIHRTGEMFLQLVATATGAGAHGIAWSSDGQTLFVTNEGAGTVTKLSHPSPTVLTVESSVEVGPGANGIVAVTP